MTKEAQARIKINKLLEKAGWRFFDDEKDPANIQLEPNAKILKKILMLLAKILKVLAAGLLIFFFWMRKDFRSLFWKQKKKKKIR